MRGRKPKPIEEHIKDGTFRFDRHGIITEKESVILRKMKYELWKLFNSTKKELKTTDIKKEPDTYKLLHSLIMEQIKVFNSLARNQTGKEVIQEKKDDKIDPDEYK